MSSPLFSIVTPIYNTDLTVLLATIESVRTQAWRDWELILVDDNSPRPDVRSFLADRRAEDPRIKVIERHTNGGISVASNDGLAAANGEFVALLDHDDLLAHGALAKVAAVIESNPSIDYVYTDEDKIDDDGNRYGAFRKPDWSPERLRAHMYTGHLSILRLSLVREVGGFDSEYDGSQDHDLVLKVTEKARTIAHIPEVLYHWRALPESTASSGDAKPYAWDVGVRAVDTHLKRVGQAASAERGPWPNTYAVRRVLNASQGVSVVIPTRGGSGIIGGIERVFVVEAVRSVLKLGGIENLEIVVVYDTATPISVLEKLRNLAGDKLTLTEYERPFNFSEKCNLGFLSSAHDRVVFLNDDMEAIQHDFLAELVAPLEQIDVGMTGGYLVFEDGHVQHAGHQYSQRGYKHPYQGFSVGDAGPFCALMIDREVSGLTAACVAVRRDVFAEVGGFAEDLPANFNDVDLSLKIRAAGYRLLWLNRVKLYHFESQTRTPQVLQSEIDLVRARWGIMYEDPYIPQNAQEISRATRAGIPVA